MADAERLRRMMVDRQIAAGGIADRRLLAAMRTGPRDHFVPEELRSRAYDDMPLPLGSGQTISQPYIVAVMIEAAAIGPDDRVLEVGLRSGYAAAIMSRLAAHVFALDRLDQPACRATARIAALGYGNVTTNVGDGTQGWPDHAPFDVISVAAGGPAVPPPLLDQLANGGRLVMPVGSAQEQRLVRLTRGNAETITEERLEAVRFVPLIGAHGWGGDERAPQPAKLPAWVNSPMSRRPLGSSRACSDSGSNALSPCRPIATAASILNRSGTPSSTRARSKSTPVMPWL